MSDLTPIARLEAKIDMMMDSISEMKKDIKESNKTVSNHNGKIELLKQSHENCPALLAYNLGQKQKPAKSGNIWAAIAVIVSISSTLLVVYFAK